MDRPAATAALRLVAMAGVVMLAGCTMCPDPYDYSGPVPNGSAPQNDFRARSNGILPLGAAPRPWPAIVRNDAHEGAKAGRLVRRLGTPTPAPDAVTVVAAESPVEPMVARSVLVAAGGESPAESREPAEATRDPWPVVPDFGDDSSGVERNADEEQPQAETVSAEVPVDEPAMTVVVPLLTETPGWRQRTQR